MGIELHYVIKDSDFVLAYSGIFQSNNLFGIEAYDTYDIVISNPLYSKIGKNDPRAVITETIVYGQPNIYAVFMVVASRLLKPDGQLVFIVPRGFAAGQYFRRFR